MEFHEKPEQQPNPDEFRCAMCGQTFPKEWSDEVAKAEQIAVGIPADEPVDVVCDDCWKLTPWEQGYVGDGKDLAITPTDPAQPES